MPTISLPLKVLLTVIAVVSSLGCDSQDESSSEKSPVSGTVTYQQKPLPGGNIVFLHESGQAVRAEIGSDGNFHVDAIQGPNRVSIVSREPDVVNPRGRPQLIPGKSRIPERYQEPRTSGLALEVGPEKNVKTFNLVNQ